MVCSEMITVHHMHHVSRVEHHSSKMTTKGSSGRARRILITGTPGTGKTRFCEAIKASLSNAVMLNVSELVKGDKSLQDSYDDILDAYVMRESRVRRAVRWWMEEHSEDVCVVECHAPGIFKKKMFHLVVVLTTDTAPHYDRLRERGYNDEKMDENITAEIMRVCWEEAVEVFGQDGVLTLSSNTEADVSVNVRVMLERVQQVN
jgi:adenylate kinase